MSHPIMFDDADPVLTRVRELALAFPAAAEKISHGRPNFHTKKVFAVYGGGTKAGPGGGRRGFDQSLIIKADPDELPGLKADPRFFEPMYWGPSGWMGLDLAAALEDVDAVDWTEVGELLDMSYRNTATTTLIRRLDAR